jgi:hypothetical protein
VFFAWPAIRVDILDEGEAMKTTTIKCASRSATFESAKDAYVRLVEWFCERVPELMNRYTEERARRGFRSLPRYAKNLENLYRPNSPQRDDENTRQRMVNGWYALTLHSGKSQFDDLKYLASLADLVFEKDWDFSMSDPTHELVEARKLACRERDGVTVTISIELAMLIEKHIGHDRHRMNRFVDDVTYNYFERNDLT